MMGWSNSEDEYQGNPIREVPAKAVGCVPQEPPKKSHHASHEMVAYTQAQRKRGCPCCGHHRLSEVSIPSYHNIIVCLGCGVAFHLQFQEVA
jgi:hypothetical protein